VLLHDATTRSVEGGTETELHAEVVGSMAIWNANVCELPPRTETISCSQTFR
jgi:hypothetical protein